MEFSGSNINKFLIFSQKKAFLIFRNGNPEKFFLFQETAYISGSNFPSPKSKKNPLLKSFLYFGEKELSSGKSNKLLIFQKGTYKAPKTNKKSAPNKFLVSCDVLVIVTAAKHREIPCEANLNII